MKPRERKDAGPGPEPPALSEAEAEVLTVLWEHGPGTVRRMNEALEARGRQWAYTTVQTLLQRLEAKGCARRDTSGLAHVYRAAASRDDLIKRRLKGVADELCGGASAPLVLALVEQHQYSAEEIARFRTLLDRMEKESKRKR